MDIIINDIVSPCPPLELIKFIHEYKTTPLPPVPFLGGGRNKSQQTAMHKITLYLHESSYEPISKKDDFILNQIAINSFKKNVREELAESYLFDDNMDTNAAKVFNKGWKRFLSGDVDSTIADIKPHIKIFKQYTKVNYQVKSMESRAVGLFLWDCKNVHQVEENYIDWVRDEFNDYDSINAKLDQDCIELLNGTNQCIKNRAVLKASAKSEKS